MSGAQVLSFGCRLNLAEGARMRALLGDAGDLVVVNSCAVTNEAVRQTRQAIRRARRERPDARLIVTGCAAETERAMLAAMPEVDGFVPNAAKLDARAWNVAPAPPSRMAPARHTRGFVAVQTGCDHACTFCIIPQGRGPSRSHTVPAVLRAVAAELERGAQEIVLTGVDLTSWGHDLGHARLGTLVAAILDAHPALPRLRLSSLDGVEIDDRLLALLADEPRVMPHVHLSLQHGHDLILKRMRRRHRAADAAALVERLRARRPGIAMGADLIAGFPTEDDAMHAANLAQIAALGIVHAHIFPYSPRPGTPAARMPQLPRELVKARAAELRAEAARVRGAWLAGRLGRAHTVLAERDGTGYCEHYARMRLPAGTQPGTLRSITPRTIEEGLLG